MNQNHKILSPLYARLLILVWVWALPCSSFALDTDVARKGVARVITTNGSGYGTGSGFFVNSDGYLLTNHHVIDGAQKYYVLTDSKARSLESAIQSQCRVHEGQLGITRQVIEKIVLYTIRNTPEARLIDADRSKDIALLKVPNADSGTPLPLVSKDAVRINDQVTALGFPGISDNIGCTSFLRLKATGGSIKSIGHNDGLNRDVYEVTNDIQRGNSGGPLLNDCGAVVGIATFGISSGGEEARFGVSVEEAQAMLDRHSVDYSIISDRCVQGTVVVVTQTGFDRWAVYLAIGLGVFSTTLLLTSKGKKAVREMVGNTKRVFKKERRHAVTPPLDGESPYLVCSAEQFASNKIPLDERIIIGRDSSQCNLVLTEHSQIGRRHCVVWFDRTNAMLNVLDCDSRNGTFTTDGTKISSAKPMMLRPGQSFYLATKELMFTFEYGSKS